MKLKWLTASGQLILEKNKVGLWHLFSNMYVFGVTNFPILIQFKSDLLTYIFLVQDCVSFPRLQQVYFFSYSPIWTGKLLLSSRTDWYFCQLHLSPPHTVILFVFTGNFYLGTETKFHSNWKAGQVLIYFIAAERQGKSSFIKMKWRTCCMDDWSTALLKTWETVRYGGRSVFLISVLRSLASLWFKQKPETGIVGRAWADLTQGPG